MLCDLIFDAAKTFASYFLLIFDRIPAAFLTGLISFYSGFSKTYKTVDNSLGFIKETSGRF